MMAKHSLFDTPATMPIAPAARAINKHPETLRSWCRKYPALGWMIGNRWVIRADAVEMIAQGVHPSLIR